MIFVRFLSESQSMRGGKNIQSTLRHASIYSMVVVIMFVMFFASAANAQKIACTNGARLPPGQSWSVIESDKAFDRASIASENGSRVGVFIETGPRQEKGGPATDWANAIEAGLNRRGNVVHIEYCSGTDIAEPGRVAIFVKGNMVFSSGLMKFNGVASKTLDEVDAKQERARQAAGLPKDTFPVK